MRWLIAFGCALIGLAAPAAADEPIPGPVRAELVRIVDADTLAVRARVWPGHVVETYVRLASADAPEVFRPGCAAEHEAARRASAFVGALIEVGDRVDLYQVRLGSFAGRVIAELHLADGRDLSALLIEAGHAAPADEDRDWCQTDLAQWRPR